MSAPPLDTGSMSVAAPVGSRRLLTAPAARLAEHLETFGRMPHHNADHIAQEIATAGLTGRGGAGFPTATKLRALAGRKPVVVANATEGEPLSDKDALLLGYAPHLVLDGLVVAARVVGAREAYVVTAREDLAEAVEDAVAERRGLVNIQVALADDRFVSGEETAVVDLLNGGPGLPTDKLVKVYERGVGGRPTLVNNAETLAQLALVARFGAEWFRSVGTPDEPGTMLATVSGAVAEPGVFEVELGTPLDVLLQAAAAEPLQAVLVGGFHGAWVPAHHIGSVSLSRASLKAYDAAPGAGVVMALGRSECGLVRAAGIARYLARQSARQCGPCVNGLPRMADTLDRLARGDVRPGMVQEVDRLQGLVRNRGACSHPDGTARFVTSTMRVFAGEVERHMEGACSAPTAR